MRVPTRQLLKARADTIANLLGCGVALRLISF